MKHYILSFRASGVRPLAKASLFVLVLACVHPVRAADRSWTGAAGNGGWSSANNWNPTGAPQNGDSLSFYVNAGTVNDLTDLRLNSIRCDSTV